MSQLPYSEDFEKALIVGVLQNPALLPQITQLVEPADFFKFNNKEIFERIVETPIDEVDSLVIQDKLSEDTKTYFTSLVRESDSMLPSLSNILVYAEEIKAKSMLRSCINIGQEISSIGFRQGVTTEEAYSELERLFSSFIYQRVKDNRDLSTKEAFEHFMNNLGNKIHEEGIRSGFYAIDSLLHRLDGLIVLAARPGMGKTALAINIARNIAATKPVLFFSLEQTQEQIFERMISSESEVNLEEIRTGAFIADKESVRKINLARKELVDVMEHFHVDERADISTGHIISTARQKRLEWGEVGIIVVDYLHIMRLNDKAKVDALGDAVKELRALGKEMGCPIILLSQLSRQQESTTTDDNRKVRRRPELTDLRSSGEIEQSADVVMFLFRESYFDSSGYVPEDDPIEVLVKKNRSGRTGDVMLSWHPKYVKFSDIS